MRLWICRRRAPRWLYLPALQTPRQRLWKDSQSTLSRPVANKPTQKHPIIAPYATTRSPSLKSEAKIINPIIIKSHWRQCRALIRKYLFLGQKFSVLLPKASQGDSLASFCGFNTENFCTYETAKHFRVKSIIRTSLKARIFRAFRRFGLARRQPCFTLSHQKSSKNHLL